ncbi:MAG: zinc-ribbon domain-containing protein [Candidatus Acidiferrales bacterium]
MSGPTAGKPGSAPLVAGKAGAGGRQPVEPADLATNTRWPTVKCPKCGSDVREVARFCQRCHHTMRYECPACKHQQREGGKCEKCGIDFLKFITAVVSQKQSEADVEHDRFEQRSNFLKNLLYLPFTFGFPLIRDYFVKRDRQK